MFVVGNVRVGPGGVVQVVLSCFASCRTAVSVSSIRSTFVYCHGRRYGPCVFDCGSLAFRLHRCVCVWGFWFAVRILWLPRVYSM